MTVTHIPSEMAEFTHWLGGLAARAERAGGWWAVFAERDPDGLGACLEGAELLPWDVVASLLQDVGEDPGPARGLYAAAAGAHDRRPGGAEALAARRALMEEEHRHAESGSGWVRSSRSSSRIRVPACRCSSSIRARRAASASPPPGLRSCASAAAAP